MGRRSQLVSLRNKLQCVGLTDTGKVREHNEDTIAVDPDIGLLVLADGMGGYNAGEVASGIAVKTIVNLVRESLEREDLRSADHATGLSRAGIILRDAVHRANKIIFQTARTQPQCEGMGTTVVGALFFDNRISIAHVGDSRLYRMRSGKFEQVTMDHSLLQELVDRGSTPPRKPSAPRTRTTSRAPWASRRTSRSRCARSRCRKAMYTCCARTGCPTWWRMTTFT